MPSTARDRRTASGHARRVLTDCGRCSSGSAVESIVLRKAPTSTFTCMRADVARPPEAAAQSNWLRVTVADQVHFGDPVAWGIKGQVSSRAAAVLRHFLEGGLFAEPLA